MTKQLPVGLLVVGIALSAISLCVRSPNHGTPSANTDNVTPAAPARAIVIDPTTQAVTLKTIVTD